MTAQEPLDPAAIVASHPGVKHHLGGETLWCDTCGADVEGSQPVWPCEPYRLAEALAYATGERDAEVYRLAAENAALRENLAEMTAAHDGWLDEAVKSGDEAADLREQVQRVPSALRNAWEAGNCTGLDGWIGEDRGQEPDQHAIQMRERRVSQALAALAGEGSAEIGTTIDEVDGELVRARIKALVTRGAR